MSDTFEIRAIKPKSIFKYRWCTAEVCSEIATHYLVYHPNNNGRLVELESRSRRCEKHARLDSQRLGIAFPEVVTK